MKKKRRVKMIKLLTAAAVLTVSMSATAKDWSLNTNNVATSLGYNQNRDAWFAAYNISGFSSPSTVTFINTNDRCYKDDVYTENQVVENTKVKFKKHCLNNKVSYTAATKAGKEFVMKQFSEKLRIEFRDVVFTGRGFNAAIKKQISFHESDGL